MVLKNHRENEFWRDDGYSLISQFLFDALSSMSLQFKELFLPKQQPPFGKGGLFFSGT